MTHLPALNFMKLPNSGLKASQDNPIVFVEYIICNVHMYSSVLIKGGMQ